MVGGGGGDGWFFDGENLVCVGRVLVLGERGGVSTEVNVFVDDKFTGEGKFIIDGAATDGVDVESESFADGVVFTGGGEGLGGGRDNRAGVGAVAV